MKVLLTNAEKRRIERNNVIIKAYNDWLAMPEAERPAKTAFCEHLADELLISHITIYRTIRRYERAIEEERRGGQDDN